MYEQWYACGYEGERKRMGRMAILDGLMLELETGRRHHNGSPISRPRVRHGQKQRQINFPIQDHYLRNTVLGISGVVHFLPSPAMCRTKQIVEHMVPEVCHLGIRTNFLAHPLSAQEI